MSSYPERCKKCGQFETFTRIYCDAGETQAPWCERRELGEHIHLQCAGCRYQWIQPCADAKKGAV